MLVTEIAPDPAYQAKLREMAEEWGVTDKVRFLGEVERSLIHDLFALSDVTIMIPSSDGLPQSMFEAFASHSFLILGDLPQYGGFVEDGTTARLVPIRDPHKLAEAMRWAAENPEIRQQAATTLRSYVVQHADIYKEAEKISQIYEALLASKLA
jgi:glycosyltransferase involved in cell wall biosynthesis